ncbi:TLP20 [Pieris rapae granulovirus Wuhan]|uniref:TLP20 n=1 Tax=Pieris rapae granulovirus Wuhan TaxID=2848030 RepID=D2J4Q3_9BBAC|nr:TLP20 [Betabaculovirus arrapae]ACZ63572.1 TLP20 [Betabaculovirus arrapae]ADO85515.1 tlp20 [Pieris rapae granulovirus]AHD24844.1 TLP20 [Pieris rapae granulovirus]
MISNTAETDSIVVYCEIKHDLCFFKTSNEYKLEKSGIPAYKLIIENYKNNDNNLWSEVVVTNEKYIVIVNEVDKGGLVGLLIAFDNNISFEKEQVVFLRKNKNQSLFLAQNTVQPVDYRAIKTNNNSDNDYQTFTPNNDYQISAPNNLLDKELCEVPEFKPTAGSSKTSPFDKYYVESNRKQ